MFRLMQKFRSRSILAAISILTAFTFLTGEIFNCCFINQAIAAKIEKAITTIQHLVVTNKTQLVMHEEGPHSHCHGHTEPSASADSTANSHQAAQQVANFTSLHLKLESNSVAIANEGHCISEQSITQQSMLESLALTLELPTHQISSIIETVPPPLQFVTHPRPQNKSSPPLFLRTLQILV